MTYTVGATLLDNRDDAIRVMIEEFLSANGLNPSSLWGRFEHGLARLNNASNKVLIPLRSGEGSNRH